MYRNICNIVIGSRSELLLDVAHLNDILVVVVKILASHTPNKSVIISGRCCMNRPFGRHDGLFVVKPNDTAFLRFAHNMANSLSIRKVEVVVCLNATTMRVRWHCVPHTTLLQLCQTHLKLARSLFESGVDNELIDCALVRFCQCAERTEYRSLERLNLAVLATIQRHPLSLVVLMGCG